MPIVFYKTIDTNKATVEGIHYMPDDPEHGLTEEKKSKGIEVYEESIPKTPSSVFGKRAVRFINPETKEIWYEQIDRDLKQEELDKIKINVTSDKPTILADDTDTATITVDIDPDVQDYLGVTNAYFLVNGPPTIEDTLLNGTASIEVSTLDVGYIHIEVSVGHLKDHVIIKAE